MDTFVNEQRQAPDMQIAGQIRANIETIQTRIQAAAHRAGRSPTEITLVAVSKTKPLAMIQAALAIGQMDFGENRLEELWEKIPAAQKMGIDTAAQPIRWHFIGTIQSRKADQVIGPLALVHSVDRVKIARRIGQAAQAAGVVVPILLEVNVSGEASKHGFSPATIETAVAEMLTIDGIDIQGLMTMAPFVDDPEETRPIFRGLRLLRDRLGLRFPDMAWPHLSMGMTNDFEVAVEEGATLVRIGSAIFGARE